MKDENTPHDIECKGNIVTDGSCSIVMGYDYGFSRKPDHVCAPRLEQPELYTRCEHCHVFLRIDRG